MLKAATCLRIVLIADGIAELFAVVAIFLPLATMGRIHSAMGLGPLPQGPVVEYMARSLSIMYAIHGGLFILAATDLRRYSGLISYLGWTLLLLGLLVIGIDFQADMPRFWTWGEGPFTVGVAIVVLILNAMVKRQNNAATQSP